MASAQMDIDEMKSKMTRIYEDEEDMQGRKRQRIENMSDKGKSQIITYAVFLAISVCHKVSIPIYKMKSVISSTHIMAVCYRIHDYARGKYNVTVVSEKTRKRESQSFTFIIENQNYTITSEDAIALWEDVYKKFQNKIRHNFPSKNEFFSQSATIMALLNLFYQRMKELQIGPDSWISTKKMGTNETIQHKVSSYGINPSYRHMASGLSWDVNVRNTLSKHTTGLCQLALLSNSRENKYSNKNKINVQRDYSFLQHIDVISEFIQNSDKKTNSPIIDRMARITHLHGDKHKRRCSPCFSTILNATVFEETFEKEEDFVNRKTKEDYDFIEKSDQKIKVFTVKSNENIGFSSKKAVLLYNSQNEIYIPIDCNVDKFMQFYFHATFGTQGEDFGVLSFMTRHKIWNVREEFGVDFFKTHIKPTNITSGKSESIIKVHRYSKNISATQNNMLASSGDVYGCMPVFAGYRITKITKEEMDFATKIKGSTKHSIDANSASIIDYLSDVIKILTKEIENNKKDDSYCFLSGRANWYDVTKATYKKGENGDVEKEKPESVCKSFWCRKQ